MREDGYYWVEFLEFGAIDALMYRDGAWHTTGTITEAEVSVIGEAIALPTPDEISVHAERLARLARRIWDESGHDPRWDGVHIDGAYWIERDGAEPELARSCEGGWSSYDWSDPDSMWEILPGSGATPPVLFGPLDNPGGCNRRSVLLERLIDDGRRQPLGTAPAAAPRRATRARATGPAKDAVRAKPRLH